MVEKKRLVLMRHAKSSWSHPGLDDHARPLNERGQRDALKVARALLECAWEPDLVVLSDSERTQETWTQMASVLGSDVEARMTRELYHGDVQDIRSELMGVDDGYNTILVLGHNPGWEEAVWHLTRKSEEMMTSNAALLECLEDGMTWMELMSAPHRVFKLHRVLRQKEL